MSTQVHRTHLRSFQRRKTRLNVDLNAVPSSDNRDQVGPSTHSVSQDFETGRRTNPIPPSPIDLEAVDDDVVISSPRAFAEAKNNSRKNNRRVVVDLVVDVDSEEQPFRAAQSGRNKRRRDAGNLTYIYNVEAASNSLRGNVNSMVSKPQPPPPPPPKEPTFNCPVCMGPLVEEMSTKCGHIFCKACIKAAIAAQNKCPTCRRKVMTKDIIRVYLPAAS